MKIKDNAVNYTAKQRNTQKKILKPKRKPTTKKPNNKRKTQTQQKQQQKPREIKNYL